MAPRDVGERVAAAEEQLDQLDREVLRMRTRLHEIESDRVAIQLLREGLAQLSGRVHDVAASIEDVAKRAAETTIAMLLTDRDQIQAVRADQRRARIMVALQALAVGIAAGGFVSALVFGIVK